MLSLLRIVVFSGAIALTGCAQSTFPVKGRVHYPDGSPVTHGRVVVESTGPAGSWGSIRPDGTFELGTFSANDGVPPGTYRVFLMSTETFPPPGDTSNFVPKPLVDKKYASAETSGLSFEVPKTVEWDITVEKPAR